MSDPDTSATSTDSLPEPAMPTAAWFYAVNGQQCGPVTGPELRILHAAGQVRPDTLVWREGLADWIPFAQADVNVASAAAPAAPGILSYATGRADPTNIFGWWWRVLSEDYACFRGRARRKEFWSFVLVNALILLGFFVPAILLESSRTRIASYVSGGLLITAAICYVGLIVPYIAAAVRRLHDTGKSGWYFLVTLFPYVGGLILLVLLARDSQPDANAYGPNPKSPFRDRG